MTEYIPTHPLPTSKLGGMTPEALKRYHERHRPRIEKRLRDFQGLLRASENRIFAELCFCILTPQSSASKCDKAVYELAKNGLLFQPGIDRGEVEERLVGVRFRRNKADYILKARERFADEDGHINIKEEISQKKELMGNQDLRNWFREEMRGGGIGLKEASHFLRNIGFGEDLAILDRHILSCLQELGVIDRPLLSSSGKPRGPTEKEYWDLEGAMEGFSQEIDIPMVELDLLLWSAKTSYILK